MLALAPELLARGHAVAVSCGSGPGIAPAGIEGLEVWPHRLRGPRLAAEARRRARAFAPTLVYAFSPRLPVITASRSYASTVGAPLFVHFEDDEWGLAAGRADDPLWRRGARRTSRAAGALLPSLWPFVSDRSLRWVAENAAGLDALTPSLSEEVRTRLDRGCRVVPPPSTRSGQGDPAATPGLSGIRPDAAVVAYTGAVFGAHLADFELALAAVGLLRAQGRSVALVQTGRTAPRFDLPALARTHGLGEESAVFLGYRNPDEVDALLARADVLVQPGHPSDFNRLRLPAKLPGYLRSGTPTVTFAVGAGELLEDRREVLKTHTGRPEELALRIAELLDDPALAAELSRNGPRAAERLFAPGHAASELVDHFSSTLSTVQPS